VRHGYVSPAVARDTYGVVLDSRTFAVDVAATAKRRTEIRKK
jgi:hypothetical protein